MQLKLWKTFAKRSNSTLRPPAAADSVKNVFLKNDTSQENPIFIIDEIDWDWSYCEWNGHYYFITDKIVGTDHCYELQCRQDVLASHISNILETTAYIKYASRRFDGSSISNLLYDNRIAQTTQKLWSKVTGEGNIFSTDSMYYALTVAGQSSTRRGTTNIYLLTSIQLADFSRFIFNNIFNQGADIIDQILKEFGDVFSSIISLRALPINSTLANSISVEASSIIIGGISSGIACRQLLDDKNIDEFEEIPLNFPVNDWRKQNIQLSLYLPLIGIIELSTSDFFEASHIRVRYVVSPTSGIINYLIYAETTVANYLIAQYEAEFGYTLPISATNTNFVGGISNLANGVFASQMSTNPALSTISAITQTVPQFFAHSISTIGNQGNPSKLSLPSVVTLFIQYSPTVVDPSNIINQLGKPVEMIDSIGAYRGYVQTINASVSGAMHDSDRNEINNLLNGGIYVE